MAGAIARRDMMEFRVLRARVELEALEDIALAVGSEINIFRGAFGHALRKVACRTECRDAKSCEVRGDCVYARFFEPVWEGGPSGYHDAPRPFVLRSSAGDGGVRQGGLLRVDVSVFEREGAPWLELVKAFERMAAEGLGPTRGRARLKTFAFGSGDMEELRLAVLAEGGARGRRGRVRLMFATPTELKAGGEVCTEPDFGALIQRLIERLWALGCLYQGWRVGDWDYREMLDLGRGVKLVDWSWRHEETVRRSSRTGQRHSIGGFTGWAEYEGVVGAFLPMLEIARWIGVGRQTVWGKGEVRVEGVSWNNGVGS